MGIVRSIDDCPTAHSWLHIFLILSLYNPCKNAVCNGNVDNEENLSVLVAYKKCLVNKFKESEDSAREVREALKDKLLKELSIRYVTKLAEKPTDSTRQCLIDDVCGYLLHTRRHVLQCKNCEKLLKTEESQLPDDYAPASYTLSRSYGGLKLATDGMLRTFSEVESVIEDFSKMKITSM